MKIIIAILFPILTLCMPLSFADSKYPVNNDSFDRTEKEVGCLSKYSNEKKNDIFNSKYTNIVKSLSGILRDVNGKNIFLDESVTNNYKKGLDVLKDCLGLAKSNFLLKSASGVSEFAIYFNTNLHKNSLNLQYDCREFLCNKEFQHE